MYYGDLADYASIYNLINYIKPDEIYNLAAQSHVSISFKIPEYTADINSSGPVRILEAIRSLNIKTKYYQAGSSEMFGDVLQVPQNENTPFNPISPYAVSKVHAHWTTICYRKAYKIFACNGILFNHESPLRGENFVTRKIVIGLVKIKKGKQKKLFLGNLYAKRDWGHAKDYVRAQWLIMQNNKPDDFVISTGKQYSVMDFIDKVAKKLKMKINWTGKGLKTKGVLSSNNRVIVSCDKRYYRPQDVNTLLGDSSKAKKKLNWKPKITIDKMIEEMVDCELGNLN